MPAEGLNLSKAMEFASLVGKCSAKPELITPTNT
jgi:hypothetical protein